MSSFMSLIFGSKNKVANLDSDTFEKMAKETEDTVILDVRTEEEYNQVKIPYSILIDIYKSDFVTQLEKLDRGKSYFVYCRSGNRSYNAAIQMKRIGFEKVYNLKNGIIDWLGPVESN